MRKFEYRHPRYRTDVPIVVHLSPTYSICGRCTDISVEGIGVRLASALSIGDVVTVEFSLEGHSVCSTARIEYCRNDNYYGMRFQFSSEQARDSLGHLLESVLRIK
jgi:hypothetical protein